MTVAQTCVCVRAHACVRVPACERVRACACVRAHAYVCALTRMCARVCARRGAVCGHRGHEQDLGGGKGAREATRSRDAVGRDEDGREPRDEDADTIKGDVRRPGHVAAI